MSDEKISTRLRYLAGERAADEMYRAAERMAGSQDLLLSEAIRSRCQEVVAIGIETVEDAEELEWIMLRNSSATPWNTFEISHQETGIALQLAASMYGPLARVAVLWHSHYVSDKPSAEDISRFPEWLCELGVVYHAPSQTSLAYSKVKM